jgi:hypothetical protein
MLANPPIPEKILKGFDPARDSLLAWLGEQINDDLLGIIAGADYGEDYNEHFQALQLIRDELSIPSPLRWVPREVLELIRWSNPENPKWKPGLTGHDGHLIRAFACATLVIAGGDPATSGYISSENETLIHLAASCQVLASTANQLYLQLLAWRVLTGTVNYEERPFFALAILLQTLVSRPAIVVEGSDLKELAEWVMVEEAALRKQLGYFYSGGLTERWLFDLTVFSQCENIWQAVARRVLLHPSTPHPKEAEESLLLIGSAVTGDPL